MEWELRGAGGALTSNSSSCICDKIRLSRCIIVQHQPYKQRSKEDSLIPSHLHHPRVHLKQASIVQVAVRGDDVRDVGWKAKLEVRHLTFRSGQWLESAFCGIHASNLNVSDLEPRASPNSG